MRFITGTIVGLLVAAFVDAVGLDNVIAALRGAERVTQSAVHQASKAVSSKRGR